MADQVSSSSNETTIAIVFPELFSGLLEIWDNCLTDIAQETVQLFQMCQRGLDWSFCFKERIIPVWVLA